MDTIVLGLAFGFLRSRLATPTSVETWVMIFDYSLAALVAAGLPCYLLYALLRSERFWRRKSLPLNSVPSGMPTWSRRQ